MTNRSFMGVFQGKMRLRISRPGFDVMNAGLTSEQLAFDSAWGHLGKVWMKGVVTLSSGQTVTIPFGRTFINPPIIAAFATMNWKYDAPGFKQLLWADVFSTATYLRLNLPSSPISQNFYYFVFES